MPEPLSSNTGLGMNVSDLPAAHAVDLRTYLNVISLSAMARRVSKRMPISPWPPVATSWWCSSTGMPTSWRLSVISERRSWKWSIGGTGK